MISAATNAVTLIIGFMMFAAVRRSSGFDRRLVLAGFSRSALLLAKLVALTACAGVVALYAGLVLLVFWRPEQFLPLLASLLASALAYGGIGIVLGVALVSELAGMFLIIMVSLVDVMVQNPVITPSTGSDGMVLLPTFGATQSAVGAAFTDATPAGYLLLALLWFVCCALIGLVTFQHRTRDYTGRDQWGDTQAASVVLVPGLDGALLVQATSGNVIVSPRLLTQPTIVVARGDAVVDGRRCGCPTGDGS
jgi:hypothetical protein